MDLDREKYLKKIMLEAIRNDKLHNKGSLALVLVILPIQEKLDHIQDKYTSSFETFAFCST